MPRNKKKLRTPDGNEVEATVIDVTGTHEMWNDYMLEDGTSLRLKVVVTEVLRLDDRYDGEGNPVYMIRSSNVLHVTSPDNLRRKP